MPKIPKKKPTKAAFWEKEYWDQNEAHARLKYTLWNLLLKLGYMGGDDVTEPTEQELIDEANRYDPRNFDAPSGWRKPPLTGTLEDDIPF